VLWLNGSIGYTSTDQELFQLELEIWNPLFPGRGGGVSERSGSEFRVQTDNFIIKVVE